MPPETAQEVHSVEEFSDIAAEIRILIGERTIRLDDAAALSAGTTVSLGDAQRGVLALMVGNVRLGTCELANSAGVMSVRVTELNI